MIKRFRTRCQICGHNNTLRITLGTESRQEHTFACAGCREDNRVALELDFENRETFELRPDYPVSFPSASFLPLENCILCDDEGTITNLDPNFLVPEEFLHEDRVFPWMYTARQMLPEKPFERSTDTDKNGPRLFDVLTELGIPRDMSGGIDAFCRAWRMNLRNRDELAEQQLLRLARLSGVRILDIWHAAAVLAFAFLGDRVRQASRVLEEVRLIRASSPREFERFRTFANAEGWLNDGIDRHVAVLSEYRRSIDQFNQTWIYASRGEEPKKELLASSSDIRAIKMFYGNAFEQLSNMLVWPACLNNIKHGREFDQFRNMTLAKYRTINKAKRADAFAENSGFSFTHGEFDSTLRNASHHGALRVSGRARGMLEYRSGDSGQWKNLRYSDYLFKCNRIQMCLFATLLIQIWVGRNVQWFFSRSARQRQAVRMQ